jgi:signal recognition particle subunit SRP9
MVYIREFNDFVSQAKTLYERNPNKVRYSMKYRHCDGMIVLKVTDDKVCLKFQTSKANDLKHVEEFNLNIMGTMASRS